MSTKVLVPCPECATPTPPTDRAVPVDSPYGTFPVRLWRYVCQSCPWVWANDAQREHNDAEYRRQRKRAKLQGMHFL